MAKRTIIEADALEWLKDHQGVGSIVTSLPDMEETSHTAEAYPEWFFNAAMACFESTSAGHPTIFYQTDRLHKGKRISKAHILFDAAFEAGKRVVWHKIVLRRDPGKIDLRRPGYTHLIAFGDEHVTAGKATPDVFDRGGVLYPNGMGIAAATVALQMAERHGQRVCDPFCGRGTVPALAEAGNFTRIVGVDIDPAQVAAAKATRLHRGGYVGAPKRKQFFGERSILTND